MADLKSMKLSKEAQEGNDIAVDGDQEYPWGLRINLDDDIVTKLGTPSLQAGDEVMIMAKATVKSVSSHEEDKAEGEVNISMSLQITDMAVEEAGKKSEGEKAKTMFPTMDDSK